MIKCPFCNSELEKNVDFFNLKCYNCSNSNLEVFIERLNNKIIAIYFYGINYSAMIMLAIKETHIADLKQNKNIVVKCVLDLKPNNFEKQIELIKLMS